MILLAGICVALVAGPACVAQQQRSANGSDDGKIVCRTDEPTGSHIPRTRCHKEVQVRDRRENDQEKIRRIQHSDALRPQPTGE